MRCASRTTRVHTTPESNKSDLGYPLVFPTMEASRRCCPLHADTGSHVQKKLGVSHLLHGLLTRFWDFITNMLISFGIDTCAPL